MSRQHDRPWTEEEKVYLLTEILKISPVQPSRLLDVIENDHIVPKWDDIPLPHGRPLRSCQNVFDEMRQSRRAFAAQAPPMFSFNAPAPASPFVPQPSLPHLHPRDPGARKRPFQDVEPTFSGIARNIQPRPSPSSTGHVFAAFPGSEGGPNVLQQSGDTSDEPSRKKRGRPSKDEVQRREAEAAARGEVYVPKRRAPRKSIETTTSLPPSEGASAPIKAESSLMSAQSSPQEHQTSVTETQGAPKGDQPAGEPMETSSPPRLPETVSAPQPTEPRPYGSFQPHLPDPQYIHRPSPGTPLSGPRYHPPLAPLVSAHQPLPGPSSTESGGTGMPPAFSHMFDTQAPPSRP